MAKKKWNKRNLDLQSGEEVYESYPYAMKIRGSNSLQCEGIVISEKRQCKLSAHFLYIDKRGNVRGLCFHHLGIEHEEDRYEGDAVVLGWEARIKIYEKL